MVNLQDHPDFFQRLAELNPDMFYRYRLYPDLGFEYINPASVTVTGYTPDEYYADAFLGLKTVHPDDKPKFDEYIKDPENFKNRILLRHIHKDGHLIWLEILNVPYYDDSGRLIAIESTSRDVTYRVELENKLHDALEQKEVLFRELQHRIKNSFMMISGLFSMEIDKAESEETLVALTQMRARVASISSLYSLLRAADKSTRVMADEYVRGLLESLLMDGQIRANQDLEPVEIAARMISPIGIIINEMVTNSLKHAFKDGRMGEIHVTLRRTPDNRLHLIVGDNGPGFPPGFTPAQSKGLGTQLIEMLSEQLGGTPRWSSTNGLLLELIVPIQ
jgi:PAS domain S-box-containing protein